MSPAEAAPSPAFPVLDPIIVDDEMENAHQDADMEFLDPARLQMSSGNAGQDFDDLLARTTSSRALTDSSESACLSPSELSVKRHYAEQDHLRQPRVMSADSPAESPDNSSRSSSSESPHHRHLRQPSIVSSVSATQGEAAMVPFGYSSSEDWMNHDLESVKEEQLFGIDASSLHTMGHGLPLHDVETSNKAMDAAFDFESAASSPSCLKTDVTPQPKPQKRFKSHQRRPSKSTRKSTSPLPQSASSFFPHGFKETPPFSGPSKVSTQGKLSPASHWGRHSPSSILEESFGGIDVNGGSPMNPNLSFGQNNLSFGMNFAPSPPRQNAQSEPQRYILTVHPTSLKSRVETQIPIRLTLFPLPPGVKKLRLPSHTISKPKFLAPAVTEPSPDTMELHTSLVCTSAMQDQQKLQRAFARARGEYYSLSNSAEDLQEEEMPLSGGEVKICPGCIQRERKRASRKKQRKPEEDELFQKDEERRVIVFNTNELKEWTEASKNAVPSSNDMPSPAIPAGAMQVELPMRIACYCRHQNEKLGFQVIFTVTDWVGNVVAQAITNSIMITDDHKTHAPSVLPGPPAPGPTPALSDGTQLPGVGVFHSGTNTDSTKTTTTKQAAYQSPSSATDLQGLQQRLNSQYQVPPGSIVPQNTTNGISNSQPSRSLSRQTSPNDFQGPVNKRRKHSSTARLPSELTMTRLENSQSSFGGAAAASQSMGNDFPTSRAFASPAERPFVSPSAMPSQFANSPPTPNSNDNNPFFNTAQRSTLDSIVQQQLMSGPNSAQPSRPGSPARNSFQEQSLNLLGPGPSTSMWPPLTNAGNRLPSVIHKLVPAEGSITGGTEVTLLGSGFYPGMEVVFGDTLATTTTFWGDKCLNCLTPPALQPGLVAVVFKHEHPTFGQMQPTQPLMPKQQQFFRYVDDRELQMYRLALGILGQKLGSQADAFQTAQQIMGSDPKAIFNMHQNGSGGGHQRQVPGLESQGQLTDLDSKMLTYLEFVDLDDSPRPPKFNTRCGTGQTLLHFASSLGLTRFVAGLLARGANPDVQDSTGNTPMHLAALSGHSHIVHRLRLAGSNASLRSVRGFTAADIASTLQAHQAALLPSRHYRSRSVGSLTASRPRRGSSASLHSLWEGSTSSSSFDNAVDDSDDSTADEEESEDVNSEADDVQESTFYRTSSRRSSAHQDATSESTRPPEDARPFSPPAAIVAWRNQLQAQINQFQQSVANVFPNLPALPPMPTLPDYQAHPMMRRITNLVPNRPTASWPTRDGWWDMLKGNNSAPSTAELPSYEDLYPRDESNEAGEEAEGVKKTAMLRAATEAVVDQHFEAQVGRSQIAPVEEDKEELKDIRIGRKVISREQQKHLRAQQAQRMKGLGSDRKLYFIWIPLLLLVVCAWIRNYVPGIWHGISSGYEFVKTRYTQGALEVGV